MNNPPVSVNHCVPQKVPLEALKRFSTELLEGDENSKKNYELNQQRINDFLKRQINDSNHLPKIEKFTTSMHLKYPGLYDYSKANASVAGNSNIDSKILASAPEYHRSLGARSRFGEGDGSFWDKWINSDVVAKEERLHADKPHIGFKRLYKSSIDGGSSANEEKRALRIKPYAVRREERKKREDRIAKGLDPDGDGEEEILVAYGSSLQSVFDAADEANAAEVISTQKKLKIDGEKIGGFDPSTLPPISPAHQSTYFGDKARAAFYDFYRQVGRQRYSLEHPDMLEKLILDEPPVSASAASMSPVSPLGSKGSSAVGSSRAHSLKNKGSQGDHQSGVNLSNDLVSSKESVGEMPSLDYLPDNMNEVGAYNPVSPRTKFVVNCLVKNINPKPHLLIRKPGSHELDISGQGIGDELAMILAQSLEDLPHLYSLNICNNKLTDVGLSAVVNVLSLCPSLTALDLSENKIDLVASKSLGNYLASPSCKLINLILNKSDIDDNEAGKFLECIKLCSTLRKVELSGNLLGSHEVKHSLDPTQVCAGTVVASLLDDRGASHIDTLILAWNMIRGESAAKIADSLKLNTSLTHLDLSFNKLGDYGGQMLGNALFSHKHLQNLNISSNEISPKACFVIAAGIHGCKSLKFVNLSENPIGEVGSEAVMRLQTILGDEVDININSCSVRLKDSSCTFDYEHADRKYTLNLAVPYDRAVCCELLRIAAYFDYESLVDFTISPDLKKNPGGSVAVLEFEINTMEKESRGGHRAQKMLKRQMGICNATSDATTAKQLFDIYSVNTDGVLGKTEMANLFKELGLIHIGNGDAKSSQSAMTLVNKMFSYYDIDGTNTIHEKEFLEFIKLLDDEAKAHVDKYKTHRFLSLVGKKEPYFPPEEGIVTCELLADASVPAFVTALSHENTNTLIHAVKAAADGGKLMNYALNNACLRVDESILLYDVLLKDVGDKYEVLRRLLPRMVGPEDARGLLEYVTRNNIGEKMIIKHKIGPSFRVFIGHPNGYYKLNLVNENHRICLQKLVELSTRAGRLRQQNNLGDTSQHGDWSSFRNLVLDGKKYLIEPSWFNKIMKADHVIEFDFIISDLPGTIGTVSNARLCNLLEHFGMITNTASTLDYLNNEDYVARQTLTGKVLYGRGEIDHRTALEAYKQLEWCHEHYHDRDLDALLTDKYLEDSVLMSLGAEEGLVAAAVAASKADSPKLAGRKGRRSPKKLVNPSTDGISKAKTYGLILKHIDNNGIIDKEVLAMRTIDALEDAIAGRYITCSQLAAMVKVLLYGNMKKNNFGTFRVKLIVSFYSQVLDLVNIDVVLKYLTPHEIGMLTFRVGWLNIWNSLRADGYYYLNLARREEKQVARVLLVLSQAEQGENMIDKAYMEDGIKETMTQKHISRGDITSIASMELGSTSTDADDLTTSPKRSRAASREAIVAADITEQDTVVNISVEETKQEAEAQFRILPEEWTTELGFPNTGVFSFKYLSHDNTTATDEAVESMDRFADVKSRVALLALTLPQIVLAKTAFKPSLERANVVMASTAMRYSFESEFQKPSPHGLPILNFQHSVASRRSTEMRAGQLRRSTAALPPTIGMPSIQEDSPQSPTGTQLGGSNDVLDAAKSVIRKDPLKRSLMRGASIKSIQEKG